MKINNMRTLQEKYNAIQEGKFSKDQFLVEARMQHPNIITRFNGYDDTVQILKNRGMISEANYSDAENQLMDAPVGAKVTGGGYGPFEKVKQNTWKNLKADSLQHSQALARQIGGFDDFKIDQPVNEDQTPKHKIVAQWMGPDFYLAKKRELDWDDKDHDLYNRLKKTVTTTGQVPDVGQSKRREIKEARLTKNSLTDYRYKPTNEMDKYPYEQILRGLRVELEGMQVQGTPTPEEYKKALTKVLKNLEKDEIFYTNQLAGRNKKVDLHDKMVDATAKNTVDTYNGMKKVKDLKEDHTKNPNDKYVVKFSKANNTYQVWEGDHLVTDFATEERAKAYADRENKKQDLTEKVLKEGIKNLIKKVLKEEDLERAERGVGNPYGTEEEYELFNSPEEGKSDAEYKRELENYLEDNQIYGYTDMLFDILTAPDEEQVADNLADFLDDHQIYGYNKGLLAIFRDYANRDQSEDEWDEADYERMSNSLKEEEIEEGIHDRDITSAPHTNIKGDMKAYDPAKRAASLARLRNFGPKKPEEKVKVKRSPEIPGFEGTWDALDDLFESVSLKDLLD